MPLGLKNESLFHKMLRINRFHKHNCIQPLILWFCRCLFLFVAMPVNAVPEPYHQSYKIYLVTRPAELEALGESYEIDPADELEKARLSPPVDQSANSRSEEPMTLERQESTGFQIVDEATGMTHISEQDEVVDQCTGEIKSVQIMAPTPGAEGQVVEIAKKELPDQFFIEYDPDVIPVNDVPKIRDGAFNVLCQNQKVWFRVDKEKAISHGIPENKILIIKGISELVDMSPYQQMSADWEKNDWTDEAVQAYNREVCMTTTDVLPHVSVLFGHATLRVNLKDFSMNSWLKSPDKSHHWYQRKHQKPDFMPDPVLSKEATPEEQLAHQKTLKLYEEYEARLTRYEFWEAWYENHRASRSKESLLLMFWPDWFENILTEEHPLFVENGIWGEKYHLTVKRRGVETINLDAHSNPTGIRQKIVHTTYRDSQAMGDSQTVGMRSALMLPFHVLSGEVATIPNNYTYTPLARPRYEPVNRPLTMHVYRTHYRPELDGEYDVKWRDIPVFPSIVYDFYSDDDDSQAKPENRQLRLTYWVGDGGDFDGQLLGRRILYKTTGKKPIGCPEGEPVCHYEYPVYRGLEYRVQISLDQKPIQEQQSVAVKQPDTASEKGLSFTELRI